MEAVEAAKDQSLFREVNERLRNLNEAFEHASRVSVFICECANRNCMKHLNITLAEYEEIRRVPTHFAVAPDPEHVFPEVERVTSEAPSHFVVEKFGEAGIASVRLDPRSRKRRANAPYVDEPYATSGADRARESV